MKLHGWCDKCHKVKRVNATNAALARYAQTGIIVGTCDACIEAKR